MAENLKEEIVREKLGGKKNWTDQERSELCHQLDNELEKHLNSREKRPMDDVWTEENWKEKMGDHPIFVPYLEENQGKTEIHTKVNDLSEGLAQLKYGPDHNTPSEIAMAFKDDGISHFKYKKYNLAKANFNEALKQSFSDDDMRAQLLNNRAATEWHLENYRSAIKDSKEAIKLKPDYAKAINRVIQCAVKLESWEEVIEWCSRGLELNENDEELVKKMKIAAKELKVSAARTRKKEAKELIKRKHEEKIYNAILERNIRLDVDPGSSLTDVIQRLQPTYPSVMNCSVHISESGGLVWPVLFLYPEVSQYDSITKFDENHSFIDHLSVMFDENGPPDWDLEGKYVSRNLDIYFKGPQRSEFIAVDSASTLGECLCDRRYLVKNGTPEFVILIRNSQYAKEYIDQMTHTI